VLLSPALSRLFGPETFGLAAVFMSILNLTSLIACLRYELAIVLPSRDEDGGMLLLISLSFAALVASLTLLGVLFLSEQICEWVGAPELEPLLWMLPVGVLANGAYSALRYWNTRKKRFGLLSVAMGVSSGVEGVLQLGAGLLGYVGAGIFIAATVAKRVVSTAILVGRTWCNNKSHTLIEARWKRASMLVQRYRKFPLVSSWTAILASLSSQAPTLLLSSLYSQEIVGYYSLATRVAQLPLILVGRAVSQVFLQRASEKRASGEGINTIMETTFKHLVSVGVLFSLVLVLIGPDIFQFVFGARWTEAGAYARILGLSLLFRFAIDTTPLFTVLERQAAGLLFIVVLSLGRFGALLIGGWLQLPPRSTLLLFTIASASIWLSLCFWQFAIVNIPPSRVVVHTVRYIAYSLPTLSVVAAAKWVLQWQAFALLLITTVACLPYLGIVLLTDADLQRMLKSVYEKLRTGRRGAIAN
jgi:O-antigen/teichoic acid export membrane protein